MKDNWKITHGMSRTRLYRIWVSMKSRCYNKNHIGYRRYGGRGITVCEDWLNNFSSFASWALSNGYSEDLSIDRIDNNFGYSPDNCRWVPLHGPEQQLGKEGARMINFNGETKQLIEWARDFGIKYTTVRERLRRGWTIEEALSPRLATRRQLHPNQPKHRSHWRYIEVHGERLYIAEASRKYNVDPIKLRKKIDRGMSPEDAIRSLQ